MILMLIIKIVAIKIRITTTTTTTTTAVAAVAAVALITMRVISRPIYTNCLRCIQSTLLRYFPSLTIQATNTQGKTALYFTYSLSYSLYHITIYIIILLIISSYIHCNPININSSGNACSSMYRSPSGDIYTVDNSSRKGIYSYELNTKISREITGTLYLEKSYDILINAICLLLNENQPMVRSKAIKASSHIMKSDLELIQRDVR